MTKIAPCGLCPNNSPAVRVYGPVMNGNKEVMVCHHHLINPGDKVERTDVSLLKKAANAVKLTLNAWYKEMLKLCPKRCENCGGKITIPDGLSPKTAVCHILPKKLFKSIQTHPLNRWFGCWQCHNDYDSSWDKARQMDVAPLCIERIAALYGEIAPEELKYLPEWMKPNNDERKNLDDQRA